MKKTVFLAAAAVVALSGGNSSAAARHPGVASQAGHVVKQFVHSSPKGLTTLYDQNSNDAGVGLTSQNFESSFDSYDNSGADDFTVPAGKGWKIKEVDVTGVYFQGSGPAVSENITFYADKDGLPGKVVKKGAVTVTGDNNFGSFVILLGKGVKLKPGHYWIGIQTNMDYSSGGQWGWEVSTVQSGSPAVWENPGDGFGTGCTTWAPLQSCSGFGPDFMFALKGKG